MNSSSKFKLDKHNNSYDRLTTVPEWLRKSPLQLHYINNCDKKANKLRHSNQYEEIEFDKGMSNNIDIISV